MMNNIYKITCIASITVMLGACSSGPKTGSEIRQLSAIDAVLEKALEDAESQGSTQQQLALLEEVYRRNSDEPEVAIRYAKALRDDEQLNKARLVLEPFLEVKEPYPYALTEMAMIYLALGDYKDAELIARKSIEIQPDQGRAFLALGTALDAQNYHKQAEVAFRRGIDNWQGDPAPILNNLALNLASQGHVEESLSVLRKAKKLAPERLEIERNLRIISTLQQVTPASSREHAPEDIPPPPLPLFKPETPQAMALPAPDVEESVIEN